MSKPIIFYDLETTGKNDDKEITLSPDVEKKIVSEMNEYESELIRKESEAILESKRIVLD